eukprot:1491184-Pyramimonas_sp.AAC.1
MGLLAPKARHVVLDQHLPWASIEIWCPWLDTEPLLTHFGLNTNRLDQMIAERRALLEQMQRERARDTHQ